MYRLSAPLIRFLLLSAAFGVSGCSKESEVRAIRVATARVESTVSGVNSGTVRSEKVAELAFGAVGRVQSLNVKLGDTVKEGEVLSALENLDLKTAVETASAELKRRQSLAQTKFVSEARVDEAQHSLAMASVALEKSLIRAPFDGVIAEMNLEVGQLSQITAVVPKPAIRLVDVRPRFVRVEIDEADLPKIRLGMPARIVVLAHRREPFRGVIRKIVPYVSTIREQDRTTEIELDFDNEGLLLPFGSSADVEIVVAANDNATAAPARFILGHGNGRHAYLVQGDTLVKRPVTVGLYNYDRAEILSGLSVGDLIAMPGDSVELVEGLRVKPIIQPWP